MNQPLSVAIEGGKLVISIGIGTLAHAANESDAFNPYDEGLRDWYRARKVCDVAVFAEDVRRELQRESEDGNTPLNRLLDKMTIAAMEDGSIGVEECAKPESQWCDECDERKEYCVCKSVTT